MADGIEILNEALAGRYGLKRELGRGGMATVYLADDARHDRQVAIKILSAELTESVGVERFQREIRTTARLNHPHILPLFDSGEAAGRLFYVMPVVEGGSLDDLLLREGTLPCPDAVELVSAAAEALQYAHDRGVVHRDVKPANILMHLGRPTIADFGISLVTDDETRLTQDGLSIGSPHYMSPEQVSGEGDPGPATDQYALGCVLYHTLQGHPPFARETVRAVLAAHLVAEPPALSGSVERGEALSPVLGRALAKDPADRFPSVAEFARAVRNAVARASAAIPSDRPGLVVLPFTNMSPDPDNEYFSDGLTDDVIADLTHIRSLRVISRTSAMRLKGSDKDVGQIARELGVRYVLEGGVRKAGDALRITARLIDAPADEPVWAERYDGTMEDVFEIQEQVARAIVDALRLHLSSGEARALAARPIQDPHAYECYLRARYEAWRFSREGLERARRYIETALGIVGENELLYGTLGHINVLYLEMAFDRGGPELAPVDELAEKIFALNPDSARGHWLRAFTTFQRGDLRNALRAGERAHELVPDDPDTLLLLGYVYAHAGRNAEARRLVDRAADLDPLTPLSRCLPGFVAIMEGRFEDAVEPYRTAWEMDPESPFSAVCFGWALAYADRLDEAVPLLDDVVTRFPESPFTSWAGTLARGVQGDPEGTLRAITPSLEAAARNSEMFARALAHAYALAGEIESALFWVEREIELGMLNYPFLAEHDRFLNNLRGEPRFEALLERVREEARRLP